MGKTSIEWTDWSINPIRARRFGIHGSVGRGHYCEKIAPGCAHCYASALQHRFQMPEFGGQALRNNVDIFLDEAALKTVRSRQKSTRFFWCDMTDFYGDFIPQRYRQLCYETMDFAWKHIHQVLTKRPGNIAKMWAPHTRDEEKHLYRDNVHLGTSISDQKTAAENIQLLMEARHWVPVLFLSVEPLLSEIDLRPWLASGDIDWVIIGGESGPHARPCNVGWVASLVTQCQAAGVPCFVKQLGTNRQSDGRSVLSPKLSGKGSQIEHFPEALRVRQLPFFAEAE